MSSPVRLLHNPRCSKSREALALLREKGVEPEIVEYLKTPLSEAQVTKLLKQLDGEPTALLRTKEAVYKELALGDKPSKKAVAQAIAQHPVLLERPVVIKGDRAVVARPPARLLELL